MHSFFSIRRESITPVAHRHQPEQVAQRGDERRDVSKRGGIEHIVYAEIGDALLDSDGRLSVAVSPDWLHFSERGYALLAANLEPVLDRVLAGAGSCCQPIIDPCSYGSWLWVRCCTNGAWPDVALAR